MRQDFKNYVSALFFRVLGRSSLKTLRGHKEHRTTRRIIPQDCKETRFAAATEHNEVRKAKTKTTVLQLFLSNISLTW